MDSWLFNHVPVYWRVRALFCPRGYNNPSWWKRFECPDCGRGRESSTEVFGVFRK